MSRASPGQVIEAERRRKGPARPDYVAKRGRPTQSQVEAIDRTILSTARDLFFEHGYAATSMEAVAAAIGISKGTLYARYPSKRELFEDIAIDRLREWEPPAADLQVPAGTSADDHLVRVGTALLRQIRAPEKTAFDRLIMAEAQRFPELAERFYREGYARLIHMLGDDLQRIGEAAGRPVSDAAGVAQIFIDGLLGWWRNQSLIQPLSDDECAAHVRLQARILTGGRDAW